MAQGKSIGVLVAEDNGDLCAAVCELIAGESDMQVTGSVQRTGELLRIVHTTTADVLVLDLDLAGESSLPALQALRAAQPRVAVVVYSGHDRRLLGHVFAQMPQCEYVTKNGDSMELLAAIRRVAQTKTGAGD